MVGSRQRWKFSLESKTELSAFGLDVKGNVDSRTRTADA